jgi:hypothetical protein
MLKDKTVALAAALGMLALAIGGAGDGKTDSGKKSTKTRQPTMIVDPADDAAGAAAVAPSVWIGVRLTPIPEVLGAHLGRSGLMVSNVVSGSPADTAGIERYDVIVSINGKPVGEMSELVENIVANGTGKAAQISVLRGGKERKISVTPVERPDDFATKFKYEDPAATDVSPDVQYFGHQFKRDPAGNWLLEPLGRLPALPDDVKDSLNDLSNPAWRQWQDVFKGMTNDPFRLRIQPDRDDPDRFLFFYPDGGDENTNVEISITASENGQTISVRRASDGTVTVERTDADGKRSEASYDNLDEVREADAEAYRTYRRFSGYRSRPVITVPPDLRNLGPMQRDFQEKIQKAIEKAREQTERALRETGRVRDLAREQVRMRSESHSTGGDGASTESVSLSVDDGHVKLSITKDGDTRTYEFDSADEFKKAEPELYKKYHSLLRDAGVRSQVRPMQVAAV